MSIIYDALKKVEESGSKNLGTRIDKSHKFALKIYLIYALVVCLGFFIANIFFRILPKPSPSNTYGVAKDRLQINKKQDVSISPGPPKEAVQETSPYTPGETKAETQKEFQASFVLNGVFFSGDEGYALINNKIVKKGNKIDGATVVRITLDEVDLEAQGSIIKLSAR